MFGVAFILIVALVLLGVLFATGEIKGILGPFLMVTYVSRLALHEVVRNVAFFSFGTGGDSHIYEGLGRWISNQWAIHGISYQTQADKYEIGPTSLPPNMFAGVIFMNGGQPAPLACTALVALALCLTALNFYKLALELGADRRLTGWVTVLLFSSPALVFYSADMYKDPISLMFTFGAVASAVRLSRAFTVTHFVLGLLCLGGLWLVRFYLVFLCIMPIVVGYMGFGSKSWARPVIFTLVLTVAFAWLVQSPHGDRVTQSVDETWGRGTGKAALDGNAYGGSAIQLAPGFVSLPARLVYTLFAPFPWMGGTVGLHLGKIDTLMFTYLIYRAAVAIRARRAVDKSALLGLGAFLLPTTISYALSLSNIGLMLRQRLPIVVVTALIALLSWRREEEEEPPAMIGASARHRGARPPRARGSQPEVAPAEKATAERDKEAKAAAVRLARAERRISAARRV